MLNNLGKINCMKPTLLFICFLILLSSCTKFQYLTVSGVNVPKNDRNELISENDTMRVEYRFSQHKGQVRIRLYNKSSEPLEIEWRKSAIIINDQTVGYHDTRQFFSGQIQSDTWRTGLGTAHTSGNVRGQIQSNEQAQFIPPQSYVESRLVAIPLAAFQNFPDEKAERDTLQFGGVVPVIFKRLPFEKENSPTRFRSYLTLKIGRGDSQKEFSVEHQFYISEIWKSASGPEYFADVMNSRSDRFYLLQ